MTDPTRLVAAQRLLTPDGRLSQGWVEIAGDRIVATGTGPAPRTPHESYDGIVTPGFVDVHAHGGGGANFNANLNEAATVLATHRRYGTTTMVASLVTNPIETLANQAHALAGLVTAGDLAGIHLEGPWLSEAHKGAHPLQLLRNPRLDDIATILTAGLGTVKMVTLAPELSGGLEAVRYLTERGVMVAIGHTDADFATTVAAIAAGARGATHLFNGMPELLHRAPGPVLALWRDSQVWIELVCDGVHLAPELVAQVMTTKPDRAVLVTDAMAATGLADGDYPLGTLTAEVRRGIARIAGTDTIAGSTLTLDRAVRVAVAAGVPVEQALLAATARPTDYLGLTGVGRIAPDHRADLVVLDNNLAVQKVMWRGTWK